MARNTLEAWIPEEDDSEVIQRVNQMSAVEALASRVPMGSDTKNVPRSAGIDVESIDKGGTYGEDTSLNDAITLTAKKAGKAIRIAEEDIDDSIADVIKTKQIDWATSYGKYLDNATLAVTAAVGTGVPYTSVYKLLATTDNNLGYTANDNITQTGTGGTTYDTLSNALGDAETGDYFDETRIIVIAHPTYRKKLRGIKDEQGQPIFVQGQGGDKGTPDTLFGHSIRWSLGAKTSPTAKQNPGGNPLIVSANRDYLRLGIRSGPESIFIDGRNGLGALTDESILKMRARRGFAGGHPAAFSIHEDNSGS